MVMADKQVAIDKNASSLCKLIIENAYCRAQKQTFGHLIILNGSLKYGKQHILEQNSNIMKQAFITTILNEMLEYGVRTVGIL